MIWDWWSAQLAHKARQAQPVQRESRAKEVSRERTAHPVRRETPVLTGKAHTKRHLPVAMLALRRNLGAILQTYKTPSSTT